jgi:hypothetical protein
MYFRIQCLIEKQSVTSKQKIVKDLDTLLKGSFNLRPRMVYKIRRWREELITSIDELESLKYFKIRVAHLIEQYHDLNKEIMVIPFFNTHRNQLKEHSEKKRILEKQFMQMLKEYPSLEKLAMLQRSSEMDTRIPRSSPPPCVCGNKKDFIRDEDRAVCAICSVEQTLISNMSSFSDVSRVNMSSKYTYNRKVHFRDCIIQYQGKQKTRIPEEIYTILEARLIELGLVDVSTSNRLKRYGKVTRSLVLDILKDLNSKDVKKFYDDIVLIHHTLTGQPCDNIEYLEDSLLEDFDKLTETYDNMYEDECEEYENNGLETIKPSKRKNFINAQFVLYQLLKKHGHPFKDADFLTLKNSERKRFHHSICQKLFSILGWKYSYSI